VERVRARGKQHPPLPLGFATPFADCLGCHAAVNQGTFRLLVEAVGVNDKGVPIAP
jgi:hypothetical protein